jgi:molybdopterin-guanine dinucleotide biosynthesis protein B
MRELRGGQELSAREALARLSPCDLALVEGFKAEAIPKLEVWRSALGKPMLHPVDPNVLAVATDSPDGLPAESRARLPILALDDYDAAATFVVLHARLVAS